MAVQLAWTESQFFFKKKKKNKENKIAKDKVEHSTTYSIDDNEKPDYGITIPDDCEVEHHLGKGSATFFAVRHRFAMEKFH